MSVIQEQLYAQLAQPVGAVFPLVGDAIYPIVGITQTQITNPYVVYQRITTPVENTLANGVPITGTRFQIDCYALTYLAASQLADAVVAQMAAWSVPNVLVSNPHDMFEDNVRLYRVILEFNVWHHGP